jgi:hypothetical protein
MSFMLKLSVDKMNPIFENNLSTVTSVLSVTQEKSSGLGSAGWNCGGNIWTLSKI